MTRTRCWRVLALAWLVGCATSGWAAAPIEGVWKTVDDDSGKARSWIRIVDAGGTYTGRIERVLDADAKPGDVCAACTDDRRHQSIIGLEIIRKLRASKTDPTAYEGGEILDPEDGKVYRLQVRVEDGGKRLQVRGYWGPFFRTQLWQRLE
jgi:uncharacterized protein (DUF2147 family)